MTLKWIRSPSRRFLELISTDVTSSGWNAGGTRPTVESVGRRCGAPGFDPPFFHLVETRPYSRLFLVTSKSSPTFQVGLCSLDAATTGQGGAGLTFPGLQSNQSVASSFCSSC